MPAGETRPESTKGAHLSESSVSRRYFAKFAAITDHLGRVAAMMEAEGAFSREEVEILARYILALRFTFRALGYKYHMSGLAENSGRIAIDRTDSGFPVHAELLQMAADAAQASKHLKHSKPPAELKAEMVRRIVGDLEHPTRLQYALSQRLYYEEIARGDLFWPQMDPDALWLGNEERAGTLRRRYLVHWAVYDSGLNVPTIYLMEVEDTGKIALPRDENRWPEVQTHLMAQAVAGLKLVTIASGFDKDFDHLHPKTLRRIHIGPMYSHSYTQQSGPIRDVLDKARAPEGEDWALAWTVEALESASVTLEKSGWFSSVEREIFAIDPLSAQSVETGATRIERALILPQRPYQVLAEQDPPGFRGLRKFVVSPSGRVLSYR
ncbi:MAG: hypothetical protein CR993_06865 [Rhodobacterales bacterium]|nr:MAG: hypothetical protein CR993_06865 [Rhodobacterales bacterium]